jgi:hypothetical protein
MSPEPAYPEVLEGVRRAIAIYAQALDDGRTDDVVATFCPDGSCDIAGMGSHQGHDALRRAFTKWKPRQPQRHLVVNTLVTEWGDREAHASSDLIFVLHGEAGWAIQLVGRYDDTLHYDGDVWRFHHRAGTFVIPSRPSAASSEGPRPP